MADRAARRDCLRGGDDRVRIDAVVAVELRERAGLAEMLHPERARAMAMDRADVRARGRVRGTYRSGWRLLHLAAIDTEADSSKQSIIQA